MQNIKISGKTMIHIKQQHLTPHLLINKYMIKGNDPKTRPRMNAIAYV